jgi:ABC-type sugar transport system ATPase subunit
LAEVAEECGIGHLLARNARRLSAGEAQRVNLARALALRAPITLLDEPLAGVDRATRLALLGDLPRLLRTFAATTVLVTHDREEAFRLAERLVVLIDGTVRAAGPTGEVYRCPPNRAAAELLGYMVLPSAVGPVAIAPGALRLGHGEPGWTMRVDRAVDMGNHEHLLGWIGETAVDVRLTRGMHAPAAGASVEVFAAGYVALPD